MSRQHWTLFALGLLVLVVVASPILTVLFRY